MIGGISYFHEFAFDLLAENERILASTFEAAIASHKAGRLQPDRRALELDGVRVDDGLPDAGGRRAHLAAADLHLRLPEARLRVLRPRRLGAVPAPVHDPAAVQLRRDRRAPGGPRHRHHERQREARPVARRARPRAQDAQGPGPAAHPGRRVAGPALHVRRRPGARDPARDGVRRGRQRRLQPLDGGLDDRARAGRGDLDGGPRPERPFRYVSDPPFEHDVQLRVPDVRKAAPGAGLRGDDPARDDARTRSSPGSAPSSRRDGCDTELSIVVPVFKEGEAVEPVLRSLDGRRRDAARDPGRVRLRRGPHGPGHRAAARGAAGHPRPAQRPRPGRAQRDEGGDRRVGAATTS